MQCLGFCCSTQAAQDNQQDMSPYGHQPFPSKREMTEDVKNFSLETTQRMKALHSNIKPHGTSFAILVARWLSYFFPKKSFSLSFEDQSLHMKHTLPMYAEHWSAPDRGDAEQTDPNRKNLFVFCVSICGWLVSGAKALAEKAGSLYYFPQGLQTPKCDIKKHDSWARCNLNIIERQNLLFINWGR